MGCCLIAGSFTEQQQQQQRVKVSWQQGLLLIARAGSVQMPGDQASVVATGLAAVCQSWICSNARGSGKRGVPSKVGQLQLGLRNQPVGQFAVSKVCSLHNSSSLSL